MGSINYRNNKLFNLGLNYEKLENEIEKDFENEDLENEEIRYIIDNEINFCYEYCNNILNNYKFNYYDIKLESGYYEGFYLSIDFNYNYFDDFIEKKYCQKELTQVKKCFLELINACGLVSYHAWWCDKYYSKKETLDMLNEFIKKERVRINDTLTDKFMKWDFIVKGIFTRTQLKELK